MAKTLSGSGRISRVRSGYVSSNRVKAFSLSGAIGLAGFGRVMARVTGLARVKLG
jgi:hypothetical protein